MHYSTAKSQLAPITFTAALVTCLAHSPPFLVRPEGSKVPVQGGLVGSDHPILGSGDRAPLWLNASGLGGLGQVASSLGLRDPSTLLWVFSQLRHREGLTWVGMVVAMVIPRPGWFPQHRPPQVSPVQ